VALAAPRNGIVEIAGPERAPFNEIVARYLKAVGDPRQVVSDPEARYFGGRVEERSLAVGRSAPRPHRFGRMAPPLTGKSLILHLPTEGKRADLRHRSDRSAGVRVRVGFSARNRDGRRIA
jgi:hypothetical protein